MFIEYFDLYKAGDYGYHECRIPALVTTKQGTILAFNEARKNTGRDSDQIDIFLRRSFDAGKRFEDVQVVATKEGWVSGNPAPVQDRDTGTIWLPFCRNMCEEPGGIRGENLIKQGKAPRQVWITYSDDDGATWSEPSEITQDVKLDNWTWYATGPGHGIQLSSGRLLVACDHCEKVYGDPKRDPDFSHIIYSDDHGASWLIGGITDKFANESTAIESADGRVCINCRNQFFEKGYDPYFRRVGWSSDGGMSFSPLVRDAGLPEPVCEGSICRYTLARDRADGKGRDRILFSNPGSSREGNRRQLTVRMSYDECRTWPVSKVIYEGGASYSDLCVAPDGTICCLYEKGSEQGVSYYSGDITLARFDLEWLTDGEDTL